MRILLVEDEYPRIMWFRTQYKQIDVTNDVDEAIRLLSLYHYDRLFLDHDLNTEPRVGRDVATWLAANPHVLPDLSIVVHSVNVVSAPKIIRELVASGREAVWLSFPRLILGEAVPA